MQFKASRGFAIGLFACVYGVAKWSNSEELRYFAMIFSVMLLLATIMLKWWNKRQHRISSDPLSIPGPNATDAQTGNLSQLSKCGSLHEYIAGLTRIYGPIGAFYWGQTRIAYISSQAILSEPQNKEILKNLDCKPLLLYQGLIPFVGLNSIEFANGHIYHAKMSKIFHKMYGKENIQKLIHNQHKMINNITNEWTEKLNTNQANDIDMERDLFLFAAQSAIYAIFGNDDNKKLIAEIMENYKQCFAAMEQRLYGHGSVTDNEKLMKELKFNINKMLDITATVKDKHCFISHFKENNELYPNNECILDEIVTIMNGIYKVYYGLLWMSYFIAKHNQIQTKIIDEIGGVFEEKEMAEMCKFDDGNKCKQYNEYMDKLMQLKYCKNVIVESLRITAIKSWTARVCNEGDIILNTLQFGRKKKVKVPAKMPIIVDLAAINTDKKQWTHPFTFKPDRHKSNNKENVIDANWNVFGGLGHRICCGEKVFQTQALIFLVNVLTKFKLELKQSTNNQINAIRPTYGVLTKPNKTIEFTVCKRQFAML